MKENKHRHLFSQAEWQWVLKIGSALHDPEDKKAFWITLIQKKEADPLYSPFQDFPAELEELKKDPKNFPGADVCAEILSMLNVHRKEESNVEEWLRQEE